MRDHGGDLDWAIKCFGDGEWVDLSTGINPMPYPLPNFDPGLWGRLPATSDVSRLEQVARRAYQSPETLGCVAVAGAQAAIQLIPRLMPPGRVQILGPTYNEHAAAFQSEGWVVDCVTAPESLIGGEVAVVVNPNNPDGRRLTPEELVKLSQRVELLVVDESFVDTDPDLSLLQRLKQSVEAQNVIVLRSFGKFYGLAGVRLGFALGSEHLVDRLRGRAGPWPVSGPALACGLAALADARWRDATVARLRRDAKRLDALAASAGWTLVGGTALFRTYDTGDAAAAQNRLARGHVWSRIFPYSVSWLRLGLAGSAQEWNRLGEIFSDLGKDRL